MFDKIQHIGYLTSDLNAAVAWFERSFGGQNAGGGNLPKIYAVPSGGRNAYVRFGRVEVEIIEPEDREGLSENILTMHHVGYVVSDIQHVASTLRNRGFKFATDVPFTNVMGQQVWYFDASTTNGVMVHLTQLAGQSDSKSVHQSIEIDKIVHAGYLVPNLDEAISWYVERLDGQHIGGGASRSGGRNAFVNFGKVQVELIEPEESRRPSGVNPRHGSRGLCGGGHDHMHGALPESRFQVRGRRTHNQLHQSAGSLFRHLHQHGQPYAPYPVAGITRRVKMFQQHSPESTSTQPAEPGLSLTPF